MTGTAASTRRALDRWSTVCGLALLCTPARAEAPAAAEPPAGEAPVAAPQASAAAEAPSDAAAAQAQRLGGEAHELFREKRYAEAIPLLERAYALSAESRFLFNLGVAHHWLSHCESARDYFESYLRREPSGPGRAPASTALEELHAICGQREPAAPPARFAAGVVEPAPPRVVAQSAAEPSLPRIVVDAEDASARPRSARPLREAPDARDVSETHRIVAWSLIGVGGAMAIAAGASALLVERAESDVEARARRASVEGWSPEARALMHNGEKYAHLAAALGVGSLLFVGAGVTLTLIAPSPTESVSAAFVGAPGLQYRARF